MRHPRRDLVLVVDDDDKIARLVSAYLERSGFETAIAHDGLAALRMIRDLDPALVVLDLMIPLLDGRAVAQAAKAEQEIAIIMLTALGATPQRVSGLEAGADDYLAKPFEPSELVARVKAVLRRTQPLRPSAPLRHRDLVIDSERRRVVGDRGELPLTGVEFDLLHALVAARGRIVSRRRLVAAVTSGGVTDIAERSVDVYITRLRAKLGDDPREPRYIATVQRYGYRMAEA